MARGKQQSCKTKRNMTDNKKTMRKRKRKQENDVEIARSRIPVENHQEKDEHPSMAEIEVSIPLRSHVKVSRSTFHDGSACVRFSDHPQCNVVIAPPSRGSEYVIVYEDPCQSTELAETNDLSEAVTYVEEMIRYIYGPGDDYSLEISHQKDDKRKIVERWYGESEFNPDIHDESFEHQD